MSTFETTKNHASSSATPPEPALAFEANQGQPRPKSTFDPSRAFRFASGFMTTLLKVGLPMGSNYLLTVPGRKSGVARTNPVTIVEYAGERWLTSPFGQVDWVRNLRAAGEGTLHRGRHSEVVIAHEVSAADAAPLFKWLLTETKPPSAVRSQYLVPPDASLADYEQEAHFHPVFRLESMPVP